MSFLIELFTMPWFVINLFMLVVFAVGFILSDYFDSGRRRKDDNLS